VIAATLRNNALPPLARLEAYIDANTSRLNQAQMRNGCLFGNFTAEVTDTSEMIRARLAEIFEEVQAAVAYCLRQAVGAGNYPRDSPAKRLRGSWSPRCKERSGWPKHTAARPRSNGSKG